MLKVMIVDDDTERSKPLASLLEQNGFEVIARVKEDINLQDACCSADPDVVIIDTESPSRDTLENICVLTEGNARPVVMFTHDGDREKIRAATQAGVSAYVVGTIPSERLTPVIDAAIARFEAFKLMRNELAETKSKLQERKLIEQAKGLLMKQRKLNEDEAYSLMRSMAMQRNMKIADLSQQLLDAAKVLDI